MSPWTAPHTSRPFRQSGCTVKLLSLRMRAKKGGSWYHFYDGLMTRRSGNPQSTA